MYQRILVPVDGGAESDRGLAQAIVVARRLGSRIRIVHVIETPFVAPTVDTAVSSNPELIATIHAGAARVLQAAVDRVRAAGVQTDQASGEICNGRLDDRIVGAARDWPADLIVMGTRARGSLARMFVGSAAEQVLRSAPCPVLVVHGAPPASP